MKTERLKYLFEVVYTDGSEYKQNPEDESVLHPLRSSFYDVDIDNVKIFTLRSPSNEFYSVRFPSGEFQMNSDKWINQCNLGTSTTTKKLVYYRQVTIDFNDSQNQHKQNIVFYLGWSTHGPEKCILAIE